VYSKSGHLLENIEFTEDDDIADYYCDHKLIALRINMYSNCGFVVLTPLAKIHKYQTPIVMACPNGHEIISDLKRDKPVCEICECTRKMTEAFNNHHLELLDEECRDMDREVERTCKCKLCNVVQTIKYNNLRSKPIGKAGCKSCAGIPEGAKPTPRVRMNLDRVNKLLDDYGFLPIAEGIYKSQKDDLDLVCKKCGKKVTTTINKILARKTLLGCGCSTR
jgi:hypothetical protein